MRKQLQRFLAVCSTIILACSLAPNFANAEKTEEDWMAGYESGINWFGKDFHYDITDTAACWELLQKPIIVLNVGEREKVFLLDAPNGKKVNTDYRGGYIAGTTSAVHVLGKDENGWTLIEGMDEYDRRISGYVRTRLLKTVTPHPTYGLIVDKLTQRLYVFIDGAFFSSCAISTGLNKKGEFYNETATGEYLISSWVGTFETEDMLVCEKALRFNDGDLFHQVPYIVLADGTKRFSAYEPKLGEKASLGCIRVPRYPNEEGLSIHWLWDNLKKNTKVVIWDDDGRFYPYPEDTTPLFYNPSGGARYHSSSTCQGVRQRYHPLAAFTYGELDTGLYAKLDPCDFCSPVKRHAWIDAFNQARGYAPQPKVTPTPTPAATPAPTQNPADIIEIIVTPATDAEIAPNETSEVVSIAILD